MRVGGSLLLLACLGAQAQIVPRVGGVSAGSVWRGNLGGILGQQPSRVTMDDLGRFDNYLAGAGAYCSALTAADYAANRLMVRSMAAYVRTMNAYSSNAQMRASLARQLEQFAAARPGDDAELRASLIVSILLGVTITRNLIELDQLRDATPDQITNLLRPCFQALTNNRA